MPVAFIERLLLEAELERIRQLSDEATPFAALGLSMLAAAGVKKLPDESTFNPWRKALQVRQARQEIPQHVADLFFELVEEKEIMPWVLSVAPMDTLLHARTDPKHGAV